MEKVLIDEVDKIFKRIEEYIENNIELKNLYYNDLAYGDFLIRDGDELGELAFYIVDTYKMLKKLYKKIK